MRIAIVYDVVYPYRLGGGEKRNWELAVRLAKLGHEVELVTIKMWDGEDRLMRDGVTYAGICPWRDDLFTNGHRTISEPYYFAKHVGTYLANNEFDVVDCNSFPYLPCFSASRALRGRSTGLAITWYEARGMKRWIQHKGILGICAGLLEIAVKNIRATHVAISVFTKERAAKVLGLTEMGLVGCGADVGKAVMAEASEKNDQILYVGRLAPYKRVDMLIEAFGHVSEEFGECALKIVGTGHSRKRLEQMAHDMGVSERVSFAEGLSEEELLREYAESKMLVLPSEQEGFGIVLVEAMAAGTPVVALDAPNSAAGSIITHEQDGLLVRDEHDLELAIARLLSDAELYGELVEGGLGTARRYDWSSAITPQVEALYESIAGRERLNGEAPRSALG